MSHRAALVLDPLLELGRGREMESIQEWAAIERGGFLELPDSIAVSKSAASELPGQG
jgi:hypothetical protein